jgi:hypothetical protein
MRRIIPFTLLLGFVVFAVPSNAQNKIKDVNATVVNEPTVHVGTMPDVNIGNEPTVQVGNDEFSPVPVTIADGANSRQLYQSTHFAVIKPDVTGPGTAFTVEIDDVPSGMRLVVESVSLSLVECDIGLMERAYIRSFSPNAFIFLPLLNNPSSASSGVCDNPPDFEAFYQGNNFLTKIYLENDPVSGAPKIVVEVNQQLEPISRGSFEVTLVGYLEPIATP